MADCAIHWINHFVEVITVLFVAISLLDSIICPLNNLNLENFCYILKICLVPNSSDLASNFHVVILQTEGRVSGGLVRQVICDAQSPVNLGEILSGPGNVVG